MRLPIKLKPSIVQMDDGARISVWDSRTKGVPVVFVHGFPETHESWKLILASMPVVDLKPYRIVVYDLRGFGKSDKRGEASLSRFYRDHETIITTLKLNPYHLVGHDWGGAIALHEARFHPERLKTLAIMNTNYWKTDTLGMWHMLFLNVPILPYLTFQFIPKSFFRFSVIRSFKHPQNLNPVMLQHYETMFVDPETTDYWIRLYRNMGRKIISGWLPWLAPLRPKETPLPRKSPRAYRVSTQLIWGADDRFNPIWVGKDIEAQLRRRGAKVRFTSIPSSGHFVQEEQPLKVAALLLKTWKN